MTVIDFPNASHHRGPPRRRAAYRSRTGACNGPNMQTLLFRSSHLIVESDEADLVRDVCFAVDRAQSKLTRIKQRLKDVQEQAAAQVQLLTAAETKLTAAIEAAQSAPTDDTNDAYRDLLEAFGKLDRHGQKSVVHYLATQV